MVGCVYALLILSFDGILKKWCLETISISGNGQYDYYYMYTHEWSVPSFSFSIYRVSWFFFIATPCLVRECTCFNVSFFSLDQTCKNSLLIRFFIK